MNTENLLKLAESLKGVIPVYGKTIVEKKDKFGRVWNLPDNELCPKCGQPDNVGDCNCTKLSDEDVKGITNESRNAINESKMVFENDKVKVIKLETKDDAAEYSKGTMWGLANERDFNNYHYENGLNIYVVLPKEGEEKYCVTVTQAPESAKHIVNKENDEISPLEAQKIFSALGIPSQA